MRDGSALGGDVFRPKAEGKFPVLMTFGPYGKDVPLKEFMQEAWDAIEKFYPDIIANSSLQVSRLRDAGPGGAGCRTAMSSPGRFARRCKSPGRLDVNGPAEFVDFYDAIEWAGMQPWCNGKVGLSASPTMPAANGRRGARPPIWPRSAVAGHVRFLPRPNPPGRHLAAASSGAGGRAA